MPGPSSLLRSGLASLLTDGANTLLRHDAATRSALARLQGKVIALQLQPGNQQWFLLPQAETIELLADFDGVPDACISGSLPALVTLALQASRGATSLAGSSVQVSGNSELLQDVMRLAAGTNLDWEALLAHVTGDVVAHQLGRVARHTLQWAGNSSSEISRQLAVYLQEELHLLPTRHEIARFCDEVDELALATDRFNARLQHYLSQDPVKDAAS